MERSMYIVCMNVANVNERNEKSKGLDSEGKDRIAK